MWIAWRLFPLAIPLVNLDITFSREEALAKAQVIAAAQRLAPADARVAAVFDHDDDAQNYIELDGGGKAAFARLVDGQLYAPFWWEVRLFRPGTIDEAMLRFRPDGTVDGFTRRLAEDYVRDAATQALTPAAAQALAQASATATWGIDLAPYRLIETSAQTRASGRVDHRLVYERDEPFGEGRVRLRLAVAGDELVDVSPLFFVPESFERRFRELRSANNTIAAVASIAAGLLYGLLGCILGTLWLLRTRTLQVKPALVAGLVVGLLLGAATLANYPAAWFAFPTTRDADSFWWREIATAAITTLGAGLSLGLVFMAAEGLTRRAFPHHPQLWRLWSRDAGGSVNVAGRTAGGYLFVPIELALIAAFYFATNRWLGWWQPSAALTDPNILSSAVPALMPIAMSLQAGFMEECLFRAIPLALGALLGAHFGQRRLGIGVAFVLQAVIFGAAHANYPGLPAYSRLVELLLPSLLWALIFLRYGLLPAILLHALFDLVLFSIPLFLIDAPGASTQQALVIGAALVPIAIVVLRRLQRGAWHELPAACWNGAWLPRAAGAEVETISVPQPLRQVRSRLQQRALPVAGILGFAAWLAFTPWQLDAPPLKIDRDTAIAAAEAALRTRGVTLGPDWRRLAQPRIVLGESTSRAAHAFAWREAGPAAYRALIGNTLAPPLWEVRFARFEGDVAERAEEWRVSVTGAGAIRQIAHRVPEARAGAALAQDSALALAQQAVRDAFGVDPATLLLRSADAAKQPARLDWSFTFADPGVAMPGGGEARVLVQVAGAEVVGVGRYLFVPEAWQRREAEKQNQHELLTIGAAVVIALATLAALIFAVLAWNRGQCDRRALIAVAAATMVGSIVNALFDLPQMLMQLSTAEPAGTQVALALLGGIAARLPLALLIGLLAGVGVWDARARAVGWDVATLPAWVAGVCGALALRGLLATFDALVPSRMPLWPEQDAWGLAWPGGAGFSAATAFIGGLAVGLFLLALLARFTVGWTRRLPAAAALLVVLATAAALPAARDLAPALVAGLVGGLTAFAVAMLVLRHDARALPAFIATTLILAGAHGAGLLALPLAWILFAASAVVIALLAWLATNYLGVGQSAAQ